MGSTSRPAPRRRRRSRSGIRHCFNLGLDYLNTVRRLVSTPSTTTSALRRSSSNRNPASSSSGISSSSDSKSNEERRNTDNKNDLHNKFDNGEGVELNEMRRDMDNLSEERFALSKRRSTSPAPSISSRSRTRSPFLLGHVPKNADTGTNTNNALDHFATPSSGRRLFRSRDTSFCSPWLHQRRRSSLLRRSKRENSAGSLHTRSESRGLPSSSADSLVSLISGTSNALDADSPKLGLNASLENLVSKPIRSTTLKPLFFEVPGHDSSTPLLGRSWLFNEIEDHLCSDLPTNKGVLILGNAGTGKTALLLRLVELSCFGHNDLSSELNNDNYSLNDSSIYGSTIVNNEGNNNNRRRNSNSLIRLASSVVGYHFCQRENAPTCNVAEFVHSLAAQLTQAPLLNEYQEMVSTSPRLQSLLSLSSCVSDPSRAFVEGVLEPLHKLGLNETEHGLKLLLIDALCDAEMHRPDCGPSLSAFLCTHLPRFPDWLRLICSARSSESASGLPMHRLHLDRAEDERLKTDLALMISSRLMSAPSIVSDANVRHRRRHLSDSSESSLEVRLTQFLVNSAQGSFLFVTLLLDLMERGHLVLKSDSFRVLPVSLDEIFQLEFNLRFVSQRAFDKVKPILSVALASLKPLTSAQIFECIQNLDNNLGWGDFRMRLANLNGFLVRRADDTLMFVHSAIREWLIRGKNNEKFRVDPRQGHAAIAIYMSNKGSRCRDQDGLELGHHLLKAHLALNNQFHSHYNTHYNSHNHGLNTSHNNGSSSHRETSASFLANSGVDPTSALANLRNIALPNHKVSRLLLLAGANPDALCWDPLIFDESYNNDTIKGNVDRTPMIVSMCGRGHFEMASLLLEFGANKDAKDLKNRTALMAAADQGHVEVVRLLLQHGADVAICDEASNSAMGYAAAKGHMGVVMCLGSADWPRLITQRAAIMAARCGHVHVLDFMLDLAEIDVNFVDENNNSALTTACSNGHLPCVETLIRRGAVIYDTLALHLAVKNGHWAVTERLLKDDNNNNNESNKAIHPLLEKCDEKGNTPLLVASDSGHVGLVDLLLSKKARIQVKNEKGRSALMLAAMKNHLNVIDLLIERGLSPVDCDNNNQSVLHLAAGEGAIDVVQRLLEIKEVVDSLEKNDDKEMRAVDCAVKSGHAGTIQVFLRRGAKLGPATWRAAADKPNVMLILLNKLLEDGNTLYKRQRFSESAHRYNYALRRLPNSSSSSTWTQLRVHLLLNLSRALRKLGLLGESAEKLRQVLQIEPSNLDAKRMESIVRDQMRTRDLGPIGAHSKGLRFVDEPQERDQHTVA